MLNRTKWLSGLAFVAILSSAATPIIASAHGSSGDERSTQDVTAEGKARATGALAAALGVEPAALKAAIKAAIEATPRPPKDDRDDPAAREAYRAAFAANLASGLGITVDQLRAAVESLRPAGRGDHEPDGHEKILGRKLADALGVTPEALAEAVRAARASVPRLTDEQKHDPAARQARAAAIEAAIAQHLGITVEAFNAAQAAVKAEAQEKRDQRREAAEAKKREHFLQALNRLVGAGIITQPQADEILAQFDLKGDARERAIKRLRALLEDRREQRRDDRREEKREHKDEAGKRDRPVLERLQKQHRDKAD